MRSPDANGGFSPHVTVPGPCLPLASGSPASDIDAANRPTVTRDASVDKAEDGRQVPKDIKKEDEGSVNSLPEAEHEGFPSVNIPEGAAV